MSAESQERISKSKFRLFTYGTSKTYKEAGSTKITDVTQINQVQNNDNDDICAKKEIPPKPKYKATIGPDPRFQQQNQTLRCFVMYTDFFRCEKILGEENDACAWFKQAYQTICPNSWISQWDELREQGLMPWSKQYYRLIEEEKKNETNT